MRQLSHKLVKYPERFSYGDGATENRAAFFGHEPVGKDGTVTAAIEHWPS
ncbi:MAG TPA: hypothetical protein VHJ16_09155 [Xanthobacteraceae bacterium]|jgi:hypothetical protein|nr:hypothetical protein [Xanthobacteraceae bacterium]